MNVVLFVLGLLLPLGQTPAGSAPPQQLVRVFVHTDDTGDAVELAGRRDSVKDLREILAKKKSLTVVSAEAGADVVVEVTDRTVTIPKVAIGVGPVTGPGGGATYPAKAVHLKVMVTYGKKEQLPFSSKNSPFEASGGWRSAADDIAKQLDKWITSNRETLLAGRGELAILAPVH
jgi:hypothetical protein